MLFDAVGAVVGLLLFIGPHDRQLRYSNTTVRFP